MYVSPARPAGQPAVLGSQPPDSPAAPAAGVGAQTPCLLFWTGKQCTSLGHLFSPKRGRCTYHCAKLTEIKQGSLGVEQTHRVTQGEVGDG